MLKNIYQKLILLLCIAPSSATLYAMDAKYQFEVKITQAEAKVHAQEPVAGLHDQDAQVQVKLAWDEQIKIPVSAAALLQSAVLKAAHEDDKDAAEIPVTYKKCTPEQFKSFCVLLESAAQDKQQELRALLQQLSAADLLEIYHVSCYYDVKVVREEIIKVLPVSLAELAKQDGTKAVQDLLAATEFLGAAAEKECKDVLIGQFPWVYAACGKLREVGGVKGNGYAKRIAWSSTGTLAIMESGNISFIAQDDLINSSSIYHGTFVEEVVWHPDGKRLVIRDLLGSIYYCYHDGAEWQKQGIYSPPLQDGRLFNKALSVHWADAQSLVFILNASENNVQHWRLHENTLQHSHTSTVAQFWGGRDVVEIQWSSRGCLFVANFPPSIFQSYFLPGIISYEYRDNEWRLLKNTVLNGDRFIYDKILLDETTSGVLYYRGIENDKVLLIEHRPNELKGKWTSSLQRLPDFPDGTGLGDKLSLAWQSTGADYTMDLSQDGSMLAIHKRVRYTGDDLFTQRAGIYPWKSFIYLLRRQEHDTWRLVDTIEIVDHNLWAQPGLKSGPIAWSMQGDRLAVTSFHGDVHILGFGENVTNISVKDLLLTMVVEQLKDSSAGASALRRDKAILEEAIKKSSTLRQALRIEPKWYSKEGITQCSQKIQRWVKRNPKTAVTLCVVGGLLAYYAKKRLAPRVKKSIIMPLVARLKRKASK